MKIKKTKKRTLVLLAAFTAISLSFSVGANALSASAATDKTNIFRDELDSDEIDDLFWETSVEDSQSISIEQVPQKVFKAAFADNIISLQYDNKISLAKGQYFEATMSVADLPNDAVTSFRFSETKADKKGITPDTAEMVSFKIHQTDGVKCGTFSSTAKKYKSADGEQNIGGWPWTTVADKEKGLGLTNPQSGSVSFKIRIYADGAANYSFADGGSENWFECVSFGYGEGTYLKAISEGYFQMLFQSAASVTLNSLEIGVYNADGKSVSGTVYKEDFDSIDNSSFKFMQGSARVDDWSSWKAIVIDNAKDNDYLAKKAKLAVPENNYADNIYEINFNLSIPELTGSAKAVVYLGAESVSDLSKASKIEFVRKDGEIGIVIDGKANDTATIPAAPFVMRITCGGDGNNTVYIDGVSVGSFQKDLAGKFIAFGTTGCTSDSKAQLAIQSGEIYKYNYKQGNGGDFVETFDDGKYNKKNLSITSQTEQRENEIKIESGALVTTNAGYTTVISTNQLYGDFEFVIEISEFRGTATNFNISWGRPNGASGYDGIGNGLYCKNGDDFYIMNSPAQSEVAYAEGYSQYIKEEAALPTDKTDDAGKPLEKSTNFFNYNFSEGNLIFKTVKQGSTVKLFMYTENSAENAWGRNNPITVIVNDYTYGTVGVLSVPTGTNMCMKIDSISVKNLDEHKADSLIVGTDADRGELVLVEEDDGPIDDPLDKPDPDKPVDSTNSAESSSEKSGCGSALFGAAGMIGAASVVTSVALFRKKRR